MRIFFDTEFIEDGKTMDLLSIGMVREDGRRFYAENADADMSKASDWVKQNVFPFLGNVEPRSRSEIAAAIIDFPRPTTSPITTPPRLFKWFAAILTALS